MSQRLLCSIAMQNIRYFMGMEGGPVMLLLVSSKIIKFEPTQNSFEGLLVEINLRKENWLVFCLYDPMTPIGIIL